MEHGHSGQEKEKMEKAGFPQVEILHKNACYAAFGGIK